MNMISINCDFREKPSKIPKLLVDNKVIVSFSSLFAGDYIINDEIVVERKTSTDFIRSIIENRIFEQCAKLKQDSRRIIILIEGNPYKTENNMPVRLLEGL